MISRLVEPEVLARALGRPEIAPLVDGFDPGDWLASPRNVALVDQVGNIALFANRGNRVFEGHTLFVSRGRAAIEIGRLMVNAAFEIYGARAVWGMTPLERRAARWFTRQLGFRSLGTVETVRGPCELFFKGV